MLARAAAAITVLCSVSNSGGDAAAAPQYTAQSRLVPISNYREWVFLSSGVDMSYSPAAMKMDHSMFNNVFVDPPSYAVFLKTGHWPDGTMLVLENRMGGTAEPPLRKGTYQTTEMMGMEVHVRDTKRFPTGWAFFGFNDNGPGEKMAEGSSCEQCHQAHAAVDTTFVQFYPTLIPTAQRLHTMSASYLHDEAAK
jgi:hypothetical protein